MLLYDFPLDDPYYDFTTPIEGATYKIVIQWMDRSESWYMALYDSSNTLLSSNVKLVPNFPLYFQKVSVQFDGEFMVVPIGSATAITRDNLTTDWQLLYIED